MAGRPVIRRGREPEEAPRAQLPRVSYERQFFDARLGKQVTLRFLDDPESPVSGTLVWVGKYTLILRPTGGHETLFWKHGLQSIE